MKSMITITVGAMALIAGTAVAFADPAVVDHSGQQLSRQPIPIQRAVSACVDAFIAKIAPGTPVQPLLVSPQSRGPMLHSQPPPVGLEVTMEARSASHALLASSTCITGPDTKVTRLITKVIEPATLAGMTTKDIRLGLVSRL